MSYILEALRKSETERRQGQVPDIGSSVQMIHNPHKPGSSSILWGVVIALLVNAVVLTWFFWPKDEVRAVVSPSVSRSQDPEEDLTSSRLLAPVESVRSGRAPHQVVVPEVAEGNYTSQKPRLLDLQETPVEEDRGASAVKATESQPASESGRAVVSLATVQPGQDGAEASEAPSATSLGAPSLGSLPASFQRRIPDLTFNSHIFSSSPGSRRVMINDQYLREGASFEGILVEQITEDGVILSLNGESFSISVVRNWNRPR